MSPPTLPGDIVGLLRRGSPVVWRGEAGWTLAGLLHGRGLIVLPYGHDDHSGGYEDLADLALDLSDPTGRAHAAWWLESAWNGSPDHFAPLARLLAIATLGEAMSPEDVDTLRRACLAVAGR